MFYEKNATGYILRIRVTPNSSKCGIGGIFTNATNTDFLKINLNAIPEKGKANQELIKYLSILLKCSKSCFTIISGETDRYKKISLEIQPSPEIENILHNLEITK
jgi:uncharacterized protein (TIGR00251 family)